MIEALPETRLRACALRRTTTLSTEAPELASADELAGLATLVAAYQRTALPILPPATESPWSAWADRARARVEGLVADVLARRATHA